MAASVTLCSRAIGALAPFVPCSAQKRTTKSCCSISLSNKTDRPFKRQSTSQATRAHKDNSRKLHLQSKPSQFAADKLPTSSTSQISGVRQRVVTVRADGEVPAITRPEKSKAEKWDSLTTTLATSSTAAFLVLMLPQILKNITNLRAGNLAPIGVLPWMGYSTGLLGNTLLLSYFAAKKETGATIVQAVGMLSTFVLLSTIFFGGFMPSPAYTVVSGVVALGLSLNLLNFGGLLPAAIFNVWQDIAGVVGLSVLPQVIYSTFAPTPSYLPGSLAAAAGVLFIVLLRLGKLPESARESWAQVTGWTATLLFMFMPVSQLVSNFTNPASVKGLSLATVLLGMAGNGLMIPRALFTRDKIWFTGSTWGCLMQGWACLLSMFMYDATDKLTFYGVSGFLLIYVATVLLMDAQANNLSNPLSSLVEVVRGRRRV